jgi:hypothetical protein
VFVLAFLPKAEASLTFDATNTGLYYPAEAPLKYQALKQTWVQTHGASLPSVYELAELAWLAHETLEGGQPVWLRLNAWRLNDGPKPWVVTPRVQVANTSLNEAVLNWRVRYTYEALLAYWYPVAPSGLLDIHKFRSKRHWISLATGAVTQEALAPSEDALRWLPSIQLLNVLQAHPDEWCHQLRLTFELQRMDPNTPPHTEDVLTVQLTLHPDLFILPIYLY